MGCRHAEQRADEGLYPEDRSFPPGSDYEFTKAHVLDRHDHWRIIISALNSSELLNPWAGVPLARALNAWIADTWLAVGDDRLYSALLMPPSDPIEAAAEVRRYGDNPGYLRVQNTRRSPRAAVRQPRLRPDLRRCV